MKENTKKLEIDLDKVRVDQAKRSLEDEIKVMENEKKKTPA